jgi:hypothetical protein
MDDDLADATPVCTRKCPVPWSKLKSGITLSRGVGKKQTDELTSVDTVDVQVVVFLAGSDESRYLGSSDESPGDWHSYTSEDARGDKKSPPSRKVPRFRTGRLAFDGRDTSLLPTPRGLE